MLHHETGLLRGVEAVVDKDLTASLLARELHADSLLLLTDVEAVRDDYGTPGPGRSAGPPPPSRAPGHSRPVPWVR